MDIHVARRSVGSIVVVDVSGELDLSTIPQLHGVLVTAVTEHPGEHLLIDIDGVLSLDDAALGVLLGAACRAREASGRLTVVCSDPRLRTRLELTRFDRAVDVVASAQQIPH